MPLTVKYWLDVAQRVPHRPGYVTPGLRQLDELQPTCDQSVISRTKVRAQRAQGFTQLRKFVKDEPLKSKESLRVITDEVVLSQDCLEFLKIVTFNQSGVLRLMAPQDNHTHFSFYRLLGDTFEIFTINPEVDSTPWAWKAFIDQRTGLCSSTGIVQGKYLCRDRDFFLERLINNLYPQYLFEDWRNVLDIFQNSIVGRLPRLSIMQDFHSSSLSNIRQLNLNELMDEHFLKTADKLLSKIL